MPSKKIQKKPKQFTRRARKTGHRTLPRNTTPMMRGAPAGVSQDLQQMVRFHPIPGGSGIGMKVCVPLYSVTALEGSTTQLGGSALVAQGGTTFGSAQLNLTNPLGLTLSSGNGAVTSVPYISPIFDLIGSAFVRYRVKRCRFDYEPQSGTDTEGRVVFAFANDPSHPVLWNSKFPSQSDLLSLSDSIAFAPWRSWTMDVSSRLMRTPYYVFGGGTSGAGAGLSSSEERFSDFGIISCLTTVNSEATTLNKIGGILYMSLEVELMEFCPISVTRPEMFSHLSKKLKIHGQAQGYGRPKAIEHRCKVISNTTSDTEEPDEQVVNLSGLGVSAEGESDQELIDHHRSMQATVTHPILGDAYRNYKHSGVSGITSQSSKTLSEEVAAEVKLTASSIEISRLKSQLDQLNHSKTS